MLNQITAAEIELRSLLRVCETQKCFITLVFSSTHLHLECVNIFFQMVTFKMKRIESVQWGKIVDCKDNIGDNNENRMKAHPGTLSNKYVGKKITWN